MKKTLLTIQVPAATRQRLKIMAAERGVSLRELVEPLLDQALTDDHRPEPEPDPRSP